MPIKYVFRKRKESYNVLCIGYPVDPVYSCITFVGAAESWFINDEFLHQGELKNILHFSFQSKICSNKVFILSYFFFWGGWGHGGGVILI